MLHPIAKAHEMAGHAGHTVPPPRTAASEASPTPASADAPVLDLCGAAVRVAGRTLWSGVDLRVGAGEFVAVLGPNGAGKSTLIKVLLGMLPAAGGEIRVLGARPGQTNHRIGYLPQRRSFDASLRIRGIDVVRLGLDGDRWGLPMPSFGARRRAARQRVDEVIELVGASAYAHRPIGHCSGGEQQRLLIAQALVRRPQLLLLDEPLDSLDLPNQSAITALISRIRHEENVAVVMVAHDVNPILPHLDQVVYLAEGGAASGTPEDVITSPTLTKLHGTPVEVLRTSDGRLVAVGQPEAPAVHTDRHGDRRASGLCAGGERAAG
ncbi:metal ABC transporter ATP-binding protein [Streptomyces decoyicus]|uniref:metal ABC transporter ATP-binding protein n=1 Tax=Streptomyces decoyicus TaxID=249567 RepID=UPI000B1B7CB2|nr:metal ABC transporter ATP-binding protein [Streptomyces decoyicus]